MEIANIVSQDKMDLGPEFNIVESMDDIIYNHLPTLIVGCEYTREIFKTELNFNDRKISEKIFWTFNKKERRKYYNNDLEDFIQYSFENSVKNIPFVYLDLIQYKKQKIKRIVTKLLSLKEYYSFYHKNMIYIYTENIIFGVDLELVGFLGLEKDKIIKKIKSRSKVFLEGNEILIEYKNYMERLENKAKYIPFIYSISNYE